MSQVNIEVGNIVYLRSDCSRSCRGTVIETKKRMIVVEWENNDIKSHSVMDLWAPPDVNTRHADESTEQKLEVDDLAFTGMKTCSFIETQESNFDPNAFAKTFEIEIKDVLTQIPHTPLGILILVTSEMN